MASAKKQVNRAFWMSCACLTLFGLSCSESRLYDSSAGITLYLSEDFFSDTAADVKSLHVYVVDEPGFWSKEYLEQRWGSSAWTNDYEVIIAILEQLRLPPPPSDTLMSGTYGGNTEYHLFFEFTSGQTGYLRIGVADEGDKASVRPYAPMIYEVDKPTALFSLLGFNRK